MTSLLLWKRNGFYLQIIQSILKKEPEEYQTNKFYKSNYNRIDEELKKREEENKQLEKAEMKQKKLDELAQLKLKPQKCLNQYKQLEPQSKLGSYQQAQACIIYKSHREERLHYLCQLKIGLNFVRNVLKEDGYFVLVTTFGHNIHFSCLKSGANQNQTYSAQFRCFLCKKTTNLRVPAYQCYTNATEKQLVSYQNSKRSTILNKLFEQFLIIMSIAIAENEDSEYVRKSIEARNFGNIIKRSIVLSIYFYFLSYPKLYTTNFLPILKSLCYLLKYFKEKNRQSLFQDIAIKHDDKVLLHAQHLVESILNSRIKQVMNCPLCQEQDSHYNQFHQLHKLRQYLLNIQSSPFNLTQRIDCLNLYKMPQDLA